MNRILKCFVIGFGCCFVGIFFTQFSMAQNAFQNSPGSAGSTLRQSAEELAALPPSSRNVNPRVGFAPTEAANNNSPQAYSSFYRTASAQSDVYPYPAVSAPRSGVGSQSNYGLSRNNANARFTNQMSGGANAPTGSLGNRFNSNNQAPVYNLSPTAATLNAPIRIANSRTPVEQQRASTLPQARPTSFSAPSSNQSQSLFQPTQPVAQPTTAYRQSVYQQPTLGLGNSTARFTQNCYCVPKPTYNPTAQNNPAAAAYQAPSLNQRVVGTPQYGAQGANRLTPIVSGPGSYSPMTNFRNMPGGTYFGQGIIGQPTAYVDGQPIRNLLRYVSP